ncbi:MAG: tetraacyldisaccharide 4'-kinase [Gammaproteobacteria bacterium]|nr:tetraacyldisaccharide 4'-kinase [Gammaproteobacteria bacterium]
MAAADPQRGWWLWSINPLSLLLWPLSRLFCALVWLRRRLYRWHWLQSEALAVPVIVVGNISLGGNGKTPVVHKLTQILRQHGHNIGILTRGYKSDFERQTLVLAPGEISAHAGDEANMLSELCQCPIGLGADRISAGRQLLQQYPQLDLLLADDGLQHYALERDVEIIVLRQQANGNGFCLPAGPLREPLSRLHQADLVIDRDGSDIQEQLGRCWNLLQPEQTLELDAFHGQPLRALAAIGFPQLFFAQLQALDLQLEGHAYPDHYAFSVDDLMPLLDQPLLVTHKDAVKLRPFASDHQWDNIWVVPLELTLSNDLQYRLMTMLERKLSG